MNGNFTTMHKYVTLITAMFLAFPVIGQQQERRLPPNINQPSVNLYAPYVSGDGNTLIYLSDYADDGHHIMYWSVRKGREWEDGKEINKLINRPTLNLRGGYALNYSGDELYFTTRKTGLGGFDIWMSERSGSDWSAPRNLGAPLNTSSNEGAPSLTADGTTMYYMDCEFMSEYKVATGCRIMVSRKVRGRWQAGTPLPDNINTGNSQMPRIMGDELTMLFASDQNSSGGFDIYMTRKEGEVWSDPVPVDVLNGSGHDAFVSAAVKGRYVYRSRKGSRDMELVETLLPEEFRSMRVMRISGTYKGPVEATLLVFDADKRTRLVNEKLTPEDEFSMVLKEGSWYDISVSENSGDYRYFSRMDDLIEVGRIDRESISLALQPAQPGDTLSSFVEIPQGSGIWSERYDFEMRRMAEMLRQNSRISLDIHLINTAYREDTIPLSCAYKIRYDTLYTPQTDTLAIFPDPLAASARKVMIADDSLSVYQATGDSLRIPMSDVTIRPVYHNDFFEEQRASVMNFFTGRGVDSLRYTVVPVRIDAPVQASGSDINGTPAEPGENKANAAERLIAIIRE